MHLHPETGIHYCISIPDESAFDDIRDAYRNCSKMRPWISIIYQDKFFYEAPSLLSDKNTCFVLWHGVDEKKTRDRKARIAVVYAEAIGEEDRMLDMHREHRNGFMMNMSGVDAVFAHTPRMSDHLNEEFGIPTYVVPCGWDPSVHYQYERVPYDGRSRGYGYWGSYVGTRCRVIPQLTASLGVDLQNLDGLFGLKLTNELSRCRAALYVPHSDVWSFSTWRIWQSVAAETPMVIPVLANGKKLDHWPMLDDECVTLPWSYSDPGWSVEKASVDLRDVLFSEELKEARANMMDSLYQKFSMDKIISEWLLPACNEVMRVPR